MTRDQEKVLDKTGSEFILTLEIFAGVISYCSKCKRFFDVRSGCEEDIRKDERDKVREAGGVVVEVVQ